MMSAWALPVIAKPSVWPLSVIVTPAAAPAAEIASTPWIELLVAPSVLRSAEVEVRLIVSPLPVPRLMVPEPMRMASSWAPVSVTVSVPEVPVRLPVSTLVIAGSGERRDVAVGHDVQHVGAGAEIDRAEAGQLRAVIVTVSLPLLPVSVSMPATVPSREVDRGGVRQHDLVAVPLPYRRRPGSIRRRRTGRWPG